MTALTLSVFLLARIAEDEAATERFLDDYVPEGAWGLTRVLAECEAKRRVIAAHPHQIDHRDEVLGCATCPEGAVAPNWRYCLTLRALALPYADHPEYRQEWRP